MKLSKIANDYFRFNPRKTDSPLPWVRGLPNQPEPGYTFIAGDQFDSVIFTREEVDARFYRPEVLSETPFYVEVPLDSHLPICPNNYGATLAVNVDQLHIIAEGSYRGTYFYGADKRVQYRPPVNLSAEALRAIGYHVASPLDRILPKHRIVPILGMDENGYVNYSPAGLLFPIRTFEEGQSCGIEVFSASALATEGLIIQMFCLIDPALAGRVHEWLGHFETGSHIEVVCRLEDTPLAGRLHEIPVDSISRFVLQPDHYFIMEDCLYVCSDHVEMRPHADPIIAQRWHGRICTAHPWDVARVAITEAIGSVGDDSTAEIEYHVGNLRLSAADLFRKRLFQERPLLQGPRANDCEYDDDIPF